MLAKCSRCTQTFQTDRAGEQACPFCGAQVRIEGPAAGPAPQVVAPGMGQAYDDAGPQDAPAPADNPAASGGFVTAFIETWKKSVFDPIPFFGRLTPGPGFGGALTYAALCLLVGSVFLGANSALMMAVQFKTMSADPNLARALSDPDVARIFKPLLDMGPAAMIGLIVMQVVLCVPMLFLQAGIWHLGLMLVGGAKNGFNATFRAIAYAQGPILFGVVPFCGAYAATFWVLVLVVIGLAKVHRITYGRAIGALAAQYAMVCCLCCVPTTGLGVMAAMSAAKMPPPPSSQRLPPMGGLPDDSNSAP